MKGLEGYEGQFKHRDDAEHLLRELPPLGGPEQCGGLLKVASEWDCSGRGGGLVLLGPSGAGKSTAALHMLRRSLAAHAWARRARWYLASDLVEDEMLIRRAKEATLLVLDDVGRDVGKESRHASRLFRLLDYRYLRSPTIITSGLTYEALKESFEDATIRRMIEFRGKKVRVLSVFQKADRSPSGVLAQDRPPSDQADLERRYG